MVYNNQRSIIYFEHVKQQVGLTVVKCKIERLRGALLVAWSIKSSTRWRADNPALGQCGVTALVAQDILGGSILKTPYEGIWHFYNLIDNQFIDFTDSQFDDAIEYQHVKTDRDDAYSDTNDAQYTYLKEAVTREFELSERPIVSEI